MATGEAFEDVLYGSESELDESGDEEQSQRGASSKRKGGDHGLRLRADDDEPMDLLQGAVSRIISAYCVISLPGLVDTTATQTRKPTEDESLVRMLIVSKPTKKAENWSFLQKNLTLTSKSVLARLPKTSEGMHIKKVSHPWTASRVGPTGASNSIKIRRSAGERTKMLMEILRWLMLRRQRIRKRTSDARKSSLATNSRQRYALCEDICIDGLDDNIDVQKAGGDVRRGRVDPYAYLPLSQVARKKGRDRIGIAGKR